MRKAAHGGARNTSDSVSEHREMHRSVSHGGEVGEETTDAAFVAIILYVS